MLNISASRVESIKDPFGILPGKRYEIMLDIKVDEEDELYSESGVYLRVIYAVEESRSAIVKSDFYERGTDRYLEFDLDEEELAAVDAYCRERLADLA